MGFDDVDTDVGGRLRTITVAAVLAGALVPAPLDVKASPFQGPPYLWVMNADGSNSHALAENVRPSSFDVNPITGAVVYAGEPYAPEDIWVVDLAGGEPQNLTTSDTWETSPAWSSDGERIAFVRLLGARGTEDRHQELLVMSANGSNERVVTFVSNQLNIGQPSWSPDGERIAFVAQPSNDNAIGGLYVVEVESGDVKQIVERTLMPDPPSWSPDSETLVFITNDRDLHTIPADGGAEFDLTDEVEGKNSPSWSPDGGRILFQEQYGGLYTVTPQGDGLRLIASGREGDWSPIGERIAYEEGNAIAVIDADGSDRTVLTYEGRSYEDDEYQPQFTPRGEQIVFLKGIWSGVPQDTRIERDIEYSIENHASFKGRVRSGSDGCVAEVPIKVQRRTDRQQWKTVIDFKTGPRGRFAFPFKDVTGSYRAVLPKTTTYQSSASFTCLREVGSVLRHRHSKNSVGGAPDRI